MVRWIRTCERWWIVPETIYSLVMNKRRTLCACNCAGNRHFMNSCERRLRRWLMDSSCVKLSATNVAAPVVSHRLSTHHTTPACRPHSRSARRGLFRSGQCAHLRDATSSMFTAVSDIVVRRTPSVPLRTVGWRHADQLRGRTSIPGARAIMSCALRYALAPIQKTRIVFQKKPRKSKT